MLGLAHVKDLIQFKGLTDSAWSQKHFCVCKDSVQHVLRTRAAPLTVLGQHLAQGIMSLHWNKSNNVQDQELL